MASTPSSPVAFDAVWERQEIEPSPRSMTVWQRGTASSGPGDAPASPAHDAARRHVLRFEVAAETLAVFRQAGAALRRCAGTPLDDDALLMEMARRVLGGPLDDGRASYQIALTLCPECGAGHQDAGPDVLAIDPDIVAMAACDAQHLGRIDLELMRAPAPRTAERPPRRQARRAAPRSRTLSRARLRQLRLSRCASPHAARPRRQPSRPT